MFSVKKLLATTAFLLRLFVNLVFINPKLVYFNMSPIGYAFYRDAISIMVIKLFRKKIIIHFHGKGIYKKGTTWLKRALCRIALERTYPISLSNKLTEDLAPVCSSKIFVVNNGIADTASAMLKDRQCSQVPHLLFLSNFLREKGILDCISAFEIIDKNVAFTASIVGDNVDLSRDELGEMIRQKGLAGKVIVSGPMYGDEKCQVFLKSDMFVFPSLNEAFPLVILEAMQFELPIIATSEGAIPEIVEDGISGFLINRNSPKEIAEKIELLISNPQMRGTMGKKGREKYLSTYTISHFEQNMEKVFREVVGIFR
jgi:glycosyltransferase involved in cell wall biosynthesis